MSVRVRGGPGRGGAGDRSVRGTLAAVAVLAVLGARPADAQQSHLIVVSGLGGEARYVDAFHEWGVAMVDAARDRFGLADSSVIFLAERPERDPARIRGRSTKENVERAVADLAGLAAPGDQVLILLIGHGSAESGEPRLNLPGPDLTAPDLARLLERLEGRRVAVVNTASASGAFLESVAAEGRLVVTATRNAAERNETIFGRFFVDAFAGDGADADRDGRISLLEAFAYARREVERTYEQERRLLTEHAVLDADGDGRADADADAAGAVVRAARDFAFVAGGARVGEAAGNAGGAGAGNVPADSALRALHERRQALEREVEALRARKETMDPARYDLELERLLVDLARTGQAIRRAGGGPR